jgi:hypothetical protein
MEFGTDMLDESLLDKQHNRIYENDTQFLMNQFICV